MKTPYFDMVAVLARSGGVFICFHLVGDCGTSPIQLPAIESPPQTKNAHCEAANPTLKAGFSTFTILLHSEMRVSALIPADDRARMRTDYHCLKL